MKCILALDQGTTSCRAILFNSGGIAREVEQREFRQIYPKPGWVEHDPEEIWRIQLHCAKRVMAKASIDPKDIEGIGIANQRETVVVWDRDTGQVLHNAIVWQDRRTSSRCEKLKHDGLTQLITSTTGLVPDPYFSATKIEWILAKIPGARRRANQGKLAFGTIDTWLVWKLSGGALHVTDPTNASRTMLYDIHGGCWSDELLRTFNIPRSMLPDVKPSSYSVGFTEAKLFGHPLPIAGIAGDQQAALFGQACTSTGMAKNTYGTGCFMLLNTGTKPIPSKNGLLTTCVASIPGQPQEYALEGSVFVAGAAIQWLRDELEIIHSASESESLAASVEDCDDVHFVPAFTGIGAPHWDPYARGAIVGLTRGTSRAHIVRAALESISFQVSEVLTAMSKDSGLKLRELRVDGGGTENRFLMQFQADLLGVPVIRAEVLETTALGAAYLAGLAVGVWKDAATIERQWKGRERFTPQMSRKEAAKRMKRWGQAVDKARAWASTES